MNNPEKNFLKAFGACIASIRKAKHLTQRQLASKIDITPAYLASIETGRRWPHLSIIHDIASALDTTPYRLVLGARLVSHE